MALVDKSAASEYLSPDKWMIIGASLPDKYSSPQRCHQCNVHGRMLLLTSYTHFVTFKNNNLDQDVAWYPPEDVEECTSSKSYKHQKQGMLPELRPNMVWWNQETWAENKFLLGGSNDCKRKPISEFSESSPRCSEGMKWVVLSKDCMYFPGSIFIKIRTRLRIQNVRKFPQSSWLLCSHWGDRTCSQFLL